MSNRGEEQDSDILWSLPSVNFYNLSQESVFLIGLLSQKKLNKQNIDV